MIGSIVQPFDYVLVFSTGKFSIRLRISVLVVCTRVTEAEVEVVITNCLRFVFSYRRRNASASSNALPLSRCSALRPRVFIRQWDSTSRWVDEKYEIENRAAWIRCCARQLLHQCYILPLSNVFFPQLTITIILREPERTRENKRKRETMHKIVQEWKRTDREAMYVTKCHDSDVRPVTYSAPQ